MRTVTNLYLLNLAFSDLAITVLNTGFSGTYNLYYNWVFSETHCVFNNVMGITPICASVFTMMVMSVERYFAIVHPLKRRPRKRRIRTIIALIWILGWFCFDSKHFFFDSFFSVHLWSSRNFDVRRRSLLFCRSGKEFRSESGSTLSRRQATGRG